MKKTLFLLIFSCFCFFIKAQGVINITQETVIEKALEQHKKINQSITQVEGWCVVIASSTDREQVMASKATFLRNYSDLKVDWVYQRPFFELRAGAFESKLEATALLYALKPIYPSAYVIQGKFAPREML
jgi:hypothetical protein